MKRRIAAAATGLALFAGAAVASAEPSYTIFMGPDDYHVATCAANEVWTLAPAGEEALVVSCAGERDPYELAGIVCLYGSHVYAAPVSSFEVRVGCLQAPQE